MNWVFWAFFIFLLSIAVSGSLECSDYDFPCDDGECIDSGLWCDGHVDCSDYSDEKYCKKSSYFNADPNKCSSTYFKCKDGPCIPKVGQCDGYKNCEDGSDEKGCPDTVSSGEDDFESHSKHIAPSSGKKTTTTTTTASKKTTTVATKKPSVKSKETSSTPYSKHSNRNSDPSQLEYSNLRPSDYFRQRKHARNWLLSQRKSDYGWGDETPRALTALYLSDLQQESEDSDMLMVKQLEVQLSLSMARNGTKKMTLTDLALYINALAASCKKPNNFYGENLILELRNGVNAAQSRAMFVNPSVYLTLCINNASNYEDYRKLHDMHVSRNAMMSRMDFQALVLLASKCIHRNTKFLPSSTYDNLRMQFIHRMNSAGLPGNIYEASLHFQALQEMQVTQTGLLEFILQQQKEDGSFGGILATYLVLPILSGRSFLRVNEHCNQQLTSDMAPIEVLKNMKRRKIPVRYSLNYGSPTEVTQTIVMQVPEGISFLNVMRLAQDMNPKFRFMLDRNREEPAVYSIGGIPNDAEKGMFWTLHLAPSITRGRNDAGRLTPYSGNIKQLIPHPGDEFVFWMKSI